MKILVSAYACEPHKGSEPGVGWNWVKQIAKFAEVWVITRANNRAVIEEELKRNPILNLHFIYYDIPKWISFWKKKTRGLYLYYFLWQIGAYRIAKRLHKQIGFDIVHHLTFGNIWLPTFMHFLNSSFIWGPVGGGEQVPKPFRKAYLFKDRVQETLRDIMLSLLRINPLFLSICKKAVSVIVRTEDTLKKIPPSFQYKTFKIIETGVPELDIDRLIKPESPGHIQILSVGRLIHLKGFDLAIKAFAQAQSHYKDMRLLIIGDGPDRHRLKKIVKDEGIIDEVFFEGALEHRDVIKKMQESSIFLFPSLKEGGPWALYEAMLMGLPVICLDIAGPSEIVSDGCGFKIKPVTPAQTINDLAEAILKLAKDPELRKKMGEAGRRRVLEHYTWDKKGEFIKKIYEKVLNKKLP